MTRETLAELLEQAQMWLNEAIERKQEWEIGVASKHIKMLAEELESLLINEPCDSANGNCCCKSSDEEPCGSKSENSDGKDDCDCCCDDDEDDCDCCCGCCCDDDEDDCDCCCGCCCGCCCDDDDDDDCDCCCGLKTVEVKFQNCTFIIPKE